MADISKWSRDAVNNQSPSPDGYPEGMAPGQVNDADRETMAAVRRQHEQAEWIDLGFTVSRVSNTEFKVVGLNATTQFTVGRRLRFSDATTLYGNVTASTYSAPDTSVEVTLDSGALTIALSAVSYGIINRENSSLRGLAFAEAGIGLDQAGNDLNINWTKLATESAPDTDNSTAAIRTNFIHYEVPLGSLAGGIPGVAEDLECQPGTNQNRQVRATADLVILAGPNGGLFPVRGIDVSANLGNSGLGGLDTGTLEDAQWYYLYVISNRTSVNAIWSKSSSYNVTRPTDWDYLGLVSAGYYVDGTTQLRRYNQIGKNVSFIRKELRKDGSTTVNVWDSLSMNAYIPTNANAVRVSMGCDNSAVLGLAPYDNGRGGYYFTSGSSGSSDNFAGALEVGRNHTVTADVPVVASRNIWTFSKGSPITVHVSGYRFA